MADHSDVCLSPTPVFLQALGCVPAVQGYLQAVRNVCDKHGALLIFDEVMCGMGRTGTLHAWEQDGVTPDIQTIGKGLGAGFVPVAGILANDKIIGALARGSGYVVPPPISALYGPEGRTCPKKLTSHSHAFRSAFVHGHTFQGHPVACAAAFRVQQVIESDCLLTNVRRMGEILGRRLMDGLIGHPHVGDIRGKGLFWGIEFVQDKALKKPFPASAGVAIGLSTMGLSSDFGISVYPGGGTADGVDGDHIMICPPYNVSEADIVFITDTVVGLVNQYFE
jgi:adenosylmethionine-8-amino-7-oxononanoate aminotransferase